ASADEPRLMATRTKLCDNFVRERFRFHNFHANMRAPAARFYHVVHDSRLHDGSLPPDGPFSDHALQRQMSALLAILKFAGKGESKGAVVFGSTPESCHRAVLHVRGGAPSVPVWLFAIAEPSAETVALCKRVRCSNGVCGWQLTPIGFCGPSGSRWGSRPGSAG